MNDVLPLEQEIAMRAALASRRDFGDQPVIPVPEIGPHAGAYGGIDAVASRAGLTTDEYRQQLAADRGARGMRMNSACGAEQTYANDQRLGIVYVP